MLFSTALLQDWLGDDAEKRKKREIHFPTGRFGEAIEQAQAVLFLASDESSFVNGTDFMVDGGLTKVCKGFSVQLLSHVLRLIGIYDCRGPPNRSPEESCSVTANCGKLFSATVSYIHVITET